MSESNQKRSLDQFRIRMDEIDSRLVSVLNERVTLSSQIRSWKREHGIPLIDLDRETSLIARANQLSEGPLSPSSLERIFRVILEESKKED